MSALVEPLRIEMVEPRRDIRPPRMIGAPAVLRHVTAEIAEG